MKKMISFKANSYSMETVEIRQDKKKSIITLSLFLAVIIGGIWYIYFSGKIKTNNQINILFGIMNVFMIYTLYAPVKRLINNEPILKLDRAGIEMNQRGRPVAFSWIQITEWSVKKDSENAYWLTVETVDSKKKINISHLHKKPEEIEKLIVLYKNK